jgi:hypothetical protein
LQLILIQKQLIKIPEFKKLVDSVLLDRTYNWDGSATNRIMCYYDNLILQEVISVINKKGIEICALMFDGLMVYGNFYENEELLREIENAVNEIFVGLNMEFDFKEHDNTIELPEEFDETNIKKYFITADNDNEIAKIVYKEFKSTIKYCNHKIYMKRNNI